MGMHARPYSPVECVSVLASHVASLRRRRIAGGGAAGAAEAVRAVGQIC